MITCHACHREVVPMRAFSWPWFLFWLLLTWIGGILYLVYFLTKPARVCPACRLDVYDGVRPRSPKSWVSGIVLTEDLPEVSGIRTRDA
jgi:hypothetical protein